MKKKVLNLSYYFWLFLVLVLIPIACSLFAEGILKLFFLKNQYILSLFQNGKLDYGFPYYISLALSLPTTMLVIIFLKNRFMLYDLEKNNVGTLFWIINACYLLTQHIQIYFFETWWKYGNYTRLKSLDIDLLENALVDYSNLYIYILPHLLNVFFLFFAIQILIWISDIEENFKRVRLILRKVFFTKEELEKIIDYKIIVPIDKEEEFKHEKEVLFKKSTYFTYLDYRQFHNKVQFEE
ncbi:hypothetical protein Fleli_3967 [Bernardetia litoralis DSM 6794]|uniref:Uncharacterized protein n=1 Tax=Bernardetia litoralis (strain ATCC 23117 / DSM 6794 / NBRC 15988 / NCIMB 1366 / Fx l1 / Sio-4) TaxID=880071 RepID=I4AQN4_BERLS|nr:hypothetical protein [Bernardetia litoralis]AFM06269.1 hypothetical protein Fleli_3967 [Bernardetia litoralis DSM 6794]